jgi:hypothetical protein
MLNIDVMVETLIIYRFQGIPIHTLHSCQISYNYHLNIIFSFYYFTFRYPLTFTTLSHHLMSTPRTSKEVITLISRCKTVEKLRTFLGTVTCDFSEVFLKGTYN